MDEDIKKIACMITELNGLAYSTYKPTSTKRMMERFWSFLMYTKETKRLVIIREMVYWKLMFVFEMRV